MSNSERLDAVMRRQVIQNGSKDNGRLTNNQTLKPYNRQIAKFCEWAQELGIRRMHDIEKMGYTPATLIQNTLSTDAAGNPLAPGELPFSKKELCQIAFSKYRIERAQKMVEHFEQRFNSWKHMPSRWPQERRAREKAKKAAMVEKQIWIEKIVEKYRVAHPHASTQQIDKYRTLLSRESRIYIRGGNYERAVSLGRPTDYDRVAVHSFGQARLSRACFP